MFCARRQAAEYVVHRVRERRRDASGSGGKAVVDLSVQMDRDWMEATQDGGLPIYRMPHLLGLEALLHK